jgi:SAM-dependent methyltransferase
MAHESMVHALDEIRRTLKPNGILIDLRPVEDNWLVEVNDSTQIQAAGRLNDMPMGLADDEAAFNAMREVVSRRWYIREKEEEFAFFYYWDTPSEMKEFMEEEWVDFEKIDDEVYQKTKSLWSQANADARVRVRVKMLITKWARGNS